MQGEEGVGGLGRGGGGRNAAEMVVVDKAGSEQTELREVRDVAGKEDSCMADPFLELEMGTSGSADVFAAANSQVWSLEHKGKPPWAGWRGLFSSADSSRCPGGGLDPEAHLQFSFLVSG